MGTFRAITFDWGKYKDSLGTQKTLLDIVVTRGREFDLSGRYPAFLANEFLVLLGKVFEGQTGLHIDEAVQHLSPSPNTRHARPRNFQAKAYRPGSGAVIITFPSCSWHFLPYSRLLWPYILTTWLSSECPLLFPRSRVNVATTMLSKLGSITLVSIHYIL